MSEHPDLFALLRGELTNRTAVEAGDHLDACAACRAELAELATAHALLVRSSSTLGGPTRPARAPGGALPPLPPRSRPMRVPRRRTSALVGLVAASVLVVGGVVSAVVTRDEPDAAPAARARATLAPVEGQGSGEVVMYAGSGESTRMRITARGLPGREPGEFFEAWLLDPDTNKMLPLGQLGPSGVASFEIDDDLLGRYSAIDVSLETDDGDPEHSVTSVLRASYDVDPPAAS